MILEQYLFDQRPKLQRDFEHWCRVILSFGDLSEWYASTISSGMIRNYKPYLRHKFFCLCDIISYTSSLIPLCTCVLKPHFLLVPTLQTWGNHLRFNFLLQIRSYPSDYFGDRFSVISFSCCAMPILFFYVDFFSTYSFLSVWVHLLPTRV